MQKLIIFDCDGVIVDSEIIAFRVAADAMTKLGYKTTAEEGIKRFMGKDAKTTQKIVFDESGIKIPKDFVSSIQSDN